MVKELDAMGVKLMVSVWPTVNPLGETYQEMEEAGLLVANEQGLPVHLDFFDKGQEGAAFVRYYDATNPLARRYIWERVKEGYYGHGIKTWWLDACEPEVRPEQTTNLRYHAGPGAAVATIYFLGGDVRSDEFKELLVRWFQFGVFCPVCRLHGVRHPGTVVGSGQMGAPNEVWSYGEEVYGLLCSLLALRERLRPYIGEQMRVAEQTRLPPMRPLFLNYPSDPLCWGVDDQFLLGDDVLVAPVLEYGAREREVYLPSGVTWQDAWTGEPHVGGRRLVAPAPLEQVPVYLREGGSVVPWGTDEEN